MKKDTFRVVTRGADGQLRIKDYGDTDTLMKLHTQIGVDDCNTDLDLRGMPVFRGLIGPMSEDKNVVRYETPDVFEALTKEWSAQPAEKKKRRRRSKPADGATAVVAGGPAAAQTANSKAAPATEGLAAESPATASLPAEAPTTEIPAVPPTIGISTFADGSENSLRIDPSPQQN